MELTPTQRRVITWGGIGLALAIALAASIALVRGALGGFAFGQRADPRVTQDIVVERLRAVARLVATEMTLRDVVTYEQTQFHSTKKTLLVVTARVAAGIDLSHGTDVNINAGARRIIISVPPAQIMSVDVVNVTTYDEQGGLFNPFQAEDRDIIQNRIRAQLTIAARQSGILEHADQSAAKVLSELLARDGYTVEIRHPPVQRPPTG